MPIRIAAVAAQPSTRASQGVRPMCPVPEISFDVVSRRAAIHQHGVDRSDITLIFVVNIKRIHDANGIPVLAQHKPHTQPMLLGLMLVSSMDMARGYQHN